MAVHVGKDGALWLATQNGVSRFDGSRFLNYGKREGLIDNRVVGKGWDYLDSLYKANKIPVKQR